MSIYNSDNISSELQNLTRNKNSKNVTPFIQRSRWSTPSPVVYLLKKKWTILVEAGVIIYWLVRKSSVIKYVTTITKAYIFRFTYNFEFKYLLQLLIISN